MPESFTHVPLLPSGLRDTLAPAAAQERYVTNSLLDRFALFGYEQVTPPLLEFEDTLFAGKGDAHRSNSFRVMDTASQKMMALRADITTQIERIAMRMPASEQPIRLSYAGHVLRVSPDGLSQERQLRQAGIEMIGDQVSELEILTASIEALQALGLEKLVVTLSLADIFEALFTDCNKGAKRLIRKAIYHKDSGSLPDATPHKALVSALLQQPLQHVLEEHDVPEEVRAQCKTVFALQDNLAAQFGNTVSILPDILDAEGFDYHQGLCFTILDAQSRHEIARGGCYGITDTLQGCGATLYIERLLASSIAHPEALTSQTIDISTSYEHAKSLREQSIITIMESKA